MSSLSCVNISYVDFKAKRIDPNARSVSSVGVRNVVRLFAVVLAAASLAACARSSVLTSRQASLEHHRETSFLTDRQVAVAKQPTPFVFDKKATESQGASYGLASFYKEGTLTASGEKFDANELTAAHPTLPFGTRLRVTNLNTGRSVTVRVNDRGPFVPGRVVDVSYSAAQTLGMVDGGIARVKLSVVQ